MSEEEFAMALSAAKFSGNFVDAVQMPNKGGIVSTRSSLRAFPDEKDFDAAMELHAEEGLIDRDLAADGVPVLSNRDKKTDAEEERRVSRYAAKIARKRKQAEREFEAERKAKETREAFMAKAREEARARVRELRAAQESASAVDRALAASQSENPHFDPDRAHRRLVVIGLKHWGG